MGRGGKGRAPVIAEHGVFLIVYSINHNCLSLSVETAFLP
jgi:hypothetical protein